jgi:hypothetical protein
LLILTSDDSPTTIVGHAILEAVENPPFSSIRELAKLTFIRTTTVYRHLTQSLGFVVKHLHWVPQSLRAPQRVERVVRSKELLHQLLLIKHHGWQFILTLDEYGFHLAGDREHIWLRPEQQPPEKPRYNIQDAKMIVTITWSPLGFICPTPFQTAGL